MVNIVDKNVVKVLQVKNQGIVTLLCRLWVDCGSRSAELLVGVLADGE